MSKAASILAGAAAALLAVAPASAQRIGFSAPPRAGHHGGHGNMRLGHRGHFPCSNAVRPCFAGGPRHDFVPLGLGGYGGYGLYGGYGGYGYDGLIDNSNYTERDYGFFSGPAEVLAGSGGAYFLYDRAYPYDWYHDPRAGVRSAPVMEAAAPAMRCDVAWVDGRGGTSSPVRVCRGRR